MATTKATIQTKLARGAVACISLTAAVLACVNLFSTMTPVAAENERIDQRLQAALDLPLAPRLALFSDLRQDQEDMLMKKPADPYGWSRLSYLRMATEGNARMAFSALLMSDLVSPYEAPQLSERAMMWRGFRGVETPDQKAYQDVLWTRAYNADRETTWATASHAGIVDEVSVALQHKDPEMAAEWKAREAGYTAKP